MAIPNSFAGIFTDVVKLLAAAEANDSQIPGLAEAKTELEQSFKTLRDLSVRRDTLKADKQTLSQALIAAMLDLKERRTEFRGFLRFKLGTRSEKLTEFQVPPQRPSKARTRTAATAARTPLPEAPAAVPVPVLPGAPSPAPAGAGNASGISGGVPDGGGSTGRG